MCYNYNDLAKAKPVCRKQTTQLINGSADLNVRIRQSRPVRMNVNRSNSSTKQVLLDKEYSNLKNMLPSLNNKPKVSKVILFFFKKEFLKRFKLIRTIFFCRFA